MVIRSITAGGSEQNKGPGPFEAVAEFLRRHPDFVPDRNCERYLVTGHPNGFLQRHPVELDRRI